MEKRGVIDEKTPKDKPAGCCGGHCKSASDPDASSHPTARIAEAVKVVIIKK